MATIVGTNKGERIVGTNKGDVIVARAATTASTAAAAAIDQVLDEPDALEKAR